MLKFCVFCGEKLVIMNSVDSQDGHAYGLCLDCKHDFRFLDLEVGNVHLLRISNTSSK